MHEALALWLDDVSGPDWVWYAKRLSANDCGATDSHQSGVYIPKEPFWVIFPSLKAGTNPDVWFEAAIAPLGADRELRGIYYNQESRNEARITNWNKTGHLLDPDHTGALVLFAFHQNGPADADGARIWLCQSQDEETTIESRIGPVEPGEGVLEHPQGVPPGRPPQPHGEPKDDCALTDAEIPPAWRANFPSALDLFLAAMERRPATAEAPDARLIARRACETSLFYSVERGVVLPRIVNGFTTVDDFVNFAGSVLNRRKSRAGKSLELHLEAIFGEERLDFAHGEVSEGTKTPDFLFPSAAAYEASTGTADSIRMLAAKTTCKDRWRQILNEADKIPVKHLLTLQHGVSINQFNEMLEAHVVLVVPTKLHAKFPKAVQPQLLSLETFITETRAKCNPAGR